MNWLILGAAIFAAYQYRDKLKAAFGGAKPLTAEDVKVLLKDHGLECKHKPPEIVRNSDGSVTITGLSAK